MLRFLRNGILRASALSLATCLTVVAASSAPRVKLVTIRNDAGGYVLKYALQKKQMEQNAHALRFAGRCDSACTLYLGVPRSRICITPGASFGFHLPYGSSPRANDLMHRYMLASYPGWVRSWISQNGGLTSGIKRMNYEYVRNFLPTCQPAFKTASPQPVSFR